MHRRSVQSKSSQGQPGILLLSCRRAPASWVASDNAIMCDVISHCIRPTYAVLPLRILPASSIVPWTPTAGRSSLPPTINQLCKLQEYDQHWRSLLCAPRGDPFHAPSIPDCRTSDDFLIRVTPGYSKGLTTSPWSFVDRWMRSIITRSHTLA